MLQSLRWQFTGLLVSQTVLDFCQPYDWCKEESAHSYCIIIIIIITWFI